MNNGTDEEFLSSFEQSLDSLQDELSQQSAQEQEEKDEAQDDTDAEVEDTLEDPEKEAGEGQEEDEESSEVEPGYEEDFQEDTEQPPAPAASIPSGSDGEKKTAPEKEEKKKADVDYEEFYATVMKPFKANGKTIELRSPEEAVQLMQMGANYTRKMQEISKHRKTIATLQENGINTDEELAFILDIKNKNPEALRKFFKDNDIDPFDVDTSTEVNYKPKVKMVSEEVLETRAILDELNSDPEGNKTLKLIADTWDDESTRFMWNNPSAFEIIHEQRVSGVYDQIMNEIHRQTTLGMLKSTGSILEKYNIVGNQLFGAGEPNNDTTRKPIDTRVASRSSTPSSNKKAKAARSPGATGKRSSSLVLEDLMELDDDKFLEAMKNRV